MRWEIPTRVAALFALIVTTHAGAAPLESKHMYGLIGKIITQPGKRDALTAILLSGISGLPGCASYVVANDPVNPDTIWITEVWVSEAAHKASLSTPMVRQAITQGRPMIVQMEAVAETQPVGGTGLLGPAE